MNEYVAAKIGEKSFAQSNILKDVWENDGWAMFTDNEIGDKCLEVPLSANKMCLDAGSSCKGDKKCEEIYLRYIDALKKGYTKNFEAFKKESKAMGYVTTAMTIAAGFFGSRDASPEMKDTDTSKSKDDEKRKKIGLAVGIGIALVTATIITVLVIRSKNK